MSILSLSLTVFSQIGTSNQPKKCFPIPVVRLIVKDLLSGDSAKAQLKLTEQQLLETETKVVVKDSIISVLRVKESNYIEKIDKQTQSFSILESHTKKVELNLKKEKIKNKYTSILSGGIIAALVLILITN